MLNDLRVATWRRTGTVVFFICQCLVKGWCTRFYTTIIPRWRWWRCWWRWGNTSSATKGLIWRMSCNTAYWTNSVIFKQTCILNRENVLKKWTDDTSWTWGLLGNKSNCQLIPIFNATWCRNVFNTARVTASTCCWVTETIVATTIYGAD